MRDIKKFKKKIHNIIEFSIFELNLILADETNDKVKVVKPDSKEYYRFHIIMGEGYDNIPSDTLIGNIFNIKVLDIKYEGTDRVRIIFDKLN